MLFRFSYTRGMPFESMVLLAVIVMGFLGLYVLVYRSQRQHHPKQLEDLVHQVFGMSAAHISEQSRQLMASEKETIKADLDNKQRAFEELVKQLQGDLKIRQDEIRLLEQDRVKKFGELSSTLDQHRLLADQLRISTEQLAKVLSNNQTRGAWGERIIEDLLQANGLIEGVHYVRQMMLGDTNLKPDIMLLLPNKRYVPVDVKFPYAEIQKMAEAETKQARDSHLKQFSQDLRLKIKKVAEYINPEENTLDYAILFVPNEMVFSFINQKFSDIVDEALHQRVIIVSPFTFIIVARTVIESYRNFMMEDRLRDVVSHVTGFTKEWSKFKEQFEKYGRNIDSLKSSYDELTTTRVRQMDRRINKIEETQIGSGEQLKLEEEIS